MNTTSILNRAFRKLIRDPLVKESLIVAEGESYTTKIQNLVYVERYPEACDLFDELTKTMFDYWKKEPQNPLYLHLLSKAAMKTKLTSNGITIIEWTISNISDKAMDFTQMFIDLGLLCRLSERPPQEELDCYIKSINSLPPENGIFASTRKLKSEAFYRAYKLSKEIGLTSDANYYLKKANELSDGIKLQYDFTTRDYYADDYGFMTPEISNRITSAITNIDTLLGDLRSAK
jgi:hypothetical protein